ncbi:hypothetical protein [Candidatus Macondimonas diazotrophica]|uniref:Uncharacterized protein n=1 Tax=Candidatus Macondimonas diazotrophica TaxID=2305248 RepID=A0A4Z0F4G9_9GAMM|nr:hypothetical protein [Candidatus Macondimonas diazotrophica]TFZ81181.1 hypothetical protein E4680_13470 [Candidatus Macondimonas diazotrophica]
MPSGTNVTATVGNHIQDLRVIAAGEISGAVLIVKPRARLSVYPGAGATVTIYKSSSPHSLISADATAGRLTYANFNGGDLSTLSSNWVMWAKGGITAADTEGPGENSAWTSFIAISTGGAASNVEIVQTP